MNAADKAFIAAVTTYLETATTKGLDAASSVIPTISDELTDTAALATAFNAFSQQLQASHEHYNQLAKGILDVDIPRQLYMAMPAKALQANLKHLTWQAQRIAEGDLNHNVHFLGDFSKAFNQLVDAVRAKHRLEQELREYQRSLQEVNATLEQRANTDALTGLRNRQYLDRQLELEISRAKRYQTPMALIMFDIDHFKSLNDRFGHLGGDEVLKALANLVNSHIRDLDVLARWGGEEFVILLPGNTLQDARAVAEKIRGLIEHHVFPIEATVTCSFGVSDYLQDDTAEHIINRADHALYAAKDAGRNIVNVSTP
jgi:diguanylate cyclase (GGDEF)-like protein